MLPCRAPAAPVPRDLQCVRCCGSAARAALAAADVTDGCLTASAAQPFAFLFPSPMQALLGAVGILTPEYLQRQVRVQLPLASLFMLRTVPLGC